jgi:hypothetical protein
MNEDVQPEDKLYPEYLTLAKIEFIRAATELDPPHSVIVVGYILHECEECLLVGTVLGKYDDYYLAGQVVNIDVSEITKRTDLEEAKVVIDQH